jgi:hypothetical protein
MSPFDAAKQDTAILLGRMRRDLAVADGELVDAIHAVIDRVHQEWQQAEAMARGFAAKVAAELGLQQEPAPAPEDITLQAAEPSSNVVPIGVALPATSEAGEETVL